MSGLVMTSGHRPIIQPRQPSHKRRQSSINYSSAPTNTILLTTLPSEFFHKSVTLPLRQHFESYGPLFEWAELPSFARIKIVFWKVDDAERLYQECDGLHVGAPGSSLETLRIYRGFMTSTELKDPESNHLQVPVQSKNFLISPPGSPPVGWEPIVEEPPNTSTLAADLITALNRIKQHEDATGLRDPHNRSNQVDGKQILIDNRPSSAPHLRHSRNDSAPFMVTLEDVDAPSSPDEAYGGGSEEVVEILDPRHEMSSSRSSSPPRLPHQRAAPGFKNIGSVRATVDSMRTAMPPRSSQ